MDPLRNAPEEQKIAALYSLIMQDPGFLQAFDQKQFAETPLHLAAKQGWTGLALEIQRLMPSFGRKLNPNGFSPLHLALLRGHAGTVSAMIKLEPELVAVQGKEGFTPLHYAAKMDKVDMLAELLLSCPDAIDKLTVREESAVHVAVKNGNLAAFGVLFGWLERTSRRGVLRWRDWEGNTALHLAASTNQPQVMDILLKEGWVWVNDKNSQGLTALDIVEERPTEANKRALQSLRFRAKMEGTRLGSLLLTALLALRISLHTRSSFIRDPKISPFANCLSAQVTRMDKILKFAAYLEVGVPSEIRSAVLVVAVLIATSTYQGVLHPPDGFSGQTPILVNITSVPHNSSTNTTFTNITSNIGVDVMKTQNADNGNGKKVIPYVIAIPEYFLQLNTVALATSLGTIIFLLPTRLYSIWLHLCLLSLMIGYVLVIRAKPWNDFIINTAVMGASFMLTYLLLGAKFLVSLNRNLRGSRRLIGSSNFFKRDEVMALLYFSK